MFPVFTVHRQKTAVEKVLYRKSLCQKRLSSTGAYTLIGTCHTHALTQALVDHKGNSGTQG